MVSINMTPTGGDSHVCCIYSDLRQLHSPLLLYPIPCTLYPYRQLTKAGRIFGQTLSCASAMPLLMEQVCTVPQWYSQNCKHVFTTCFTSGSLVLVVDLPTGLSCQRHRSVYDDNTLLLRQGASPKKKPCIFFSKGAHLPAGISRSGSESESLLLQLQNKWFATWNKCEH